MIGYSFFGPRCLKLYHYSTTTNTNLPGMGSQMIKHSKWYYCGSISLYIMAESSHSPRHDNAVSAGVEQTERIGWEVQPQLVSGLVSTAGNISVGEGEATQPKSTTTDTQQNEAMKEVMHVLCVAQGRASTITLNLLVERTTSTTTPHDWRRLGPRLRRVGELEQHVFGGRAGMAAGCRGRDASCRSGPWWEMVERRSLHERRVVGDETMRAIRLVGSAPLEEIILFGTSKGNHTVLRSFLSWGMGREAELRGICGGMRNRVETCRVEMHLKRTWNRCCASAVE